MPGEQHQTRRGEGHPTDRKWGRVFMGGDAEAEPGSYLIGWLLRGCVNRKILVGCLRSVVLNLEAFSGIDSGVGFGSLTQATGVLRPLGLLASLFC